MVWLEAHLRRGRHARLLLVMKNEIKVRIIPIYFFSELLILPSVEFPYNSTSFGSGPLPFSVETLLTCMIPPGIQIEVVNIYGI